MIQAGTLSLLAVVLSASNAISGPVGGRDLQAIDMLPGVVEAWQTVDLTTPVSGVIREMTAREMQQVERDEVLAVLDDRLARASLAAAEAVAEREASLRRAQSNVSLAEKYLARVRDAYERQAASALELDEARGRLEEAQAGLAQALEQKREADAQVSLERVRLAGHELRAPFAGTVMRITGRPGAAANPNQSLLRLTNLSQLRVALYVPVEYFGRLAVGQEYTLAAEAPAPPRVRAVLIAEEPIIDAATDTFRCVFEIDNSELLLPSGFAVRLCEPGATDSSTAE